MLNDTEKTLYFQIYLQITCCNSKYLGKCGNILASIIIFETMQKLLNKLWNFEFETNRSIYIIIIGIVVILGSVLYVAGEVMFGMLPDFKNYTIHHYFSAIKNGVDTNASAFEKYFPQIWLTSAFICIVIRVAVIINGYYLSKKKIGNAAFGFYFITYFTSFFIALAAGMLILFLMAFFAELGGINLQNADNLIAFGIANFETWLNQNIPSLIQVKNYYLAIAISIIVASLPLYFIHWLSHQSRFCWYVFHRAHHCPQFLHPMAAPPAFAFDFLLLIPSGLVAILVSKLIYTEPLIREMSLWLLASYCFEIFNHSSVHYNFAYNNFFVRNLSRLFGDRGVYHYVHHSAYEQDQVINLSGGPLMLWDRIFGTYRKPYSEAPPIGLTNLPDIKMNPFRIIFSGIWQLIYEFKHNKNWKIRYQIIFGSIYYKPPITKEFLIVEKTGR